MSFPHRIKQEVIPSDRPFNIFAFASRPSCPSYSVKLKSEAIESRGSTEGHPMEKARKMESANPISFMSSAPASAHNDSRQETQRVNEPQDDR